MVITKEHVDGWLENGQDLGDNEIKVLEPFVQKFQFYAPAQAILAKAYYNTNSNKYEKQLRKASLTAENRLWLYNYIHTVSYSPVAETTTTGEKIVLRKGDGQIIESKTETEPLHAIEPKLSLDTADNLNGTIADNLILKNVDDELLEKAVEEDLLTANNSEEGDNIALNEEKATALKQPQDIQPILNEEGHIELNEVNQQLETLSDIALADGEKLDLHESENQEMGFLSWLDYTKYNFTNFDEEKETLSEDLSIANASNIDKTADLLQKFLENKPKIGEERPTFYNPEKMSEKSDLLDNIAVSETLAAVYMTQGEPELAISVYEKLALKFPQKSTYFATLIKDLKEKHRL